MGYKCAFCGKTYEDLDKYAECVRKCAVKEKETHEEERQKKLAEEKDKRAEEIATVDAHLRDLVTAFNNDYNEHWIHTCVMKLCNNRTDTFDLFPFLRF